MAKTITRNIFVLLVLGFTLSVTDLSAQSRSGKADEPSSGGWRFRKWGEYIGKHEVTCEYIYDEPDIDFVYCFHIYEKR